MAPGPRRPARRCSARSARHEDAFATYHARDREHVGAARAGEPPVEARLPSLTLRHGIHAAEAWVAWADEAEAVLPTLVGPPPPGQSVAGSPPADLSGGAAT